MCGGYYMLVHTMKVQESVDRCSDNMVVLVHLHRSLHRAALIINFGIFLVAKFIFMYALNFFKNNIFGNNRICQGFYVCINKTLSLLSFFHLVLIIWFAQYEKTLITNYCIE